MSDVQQIVNSQGEVLHRIPFPEQGFAGTAVNGSECEVCAESGRLVRTVAGYEGLPDGTILEVVNGLLKDVLHKVNGEFLFAGAFGPFSAGYMGTRFVCSVVRLGGDQ